MSQETNEERKMVELTVDISDSPLSNPDIYPTKIEERTWNKWDIAALWVGMAICIPTYMLAASLLGSGMNWWQAVFTILVGNVIVLIPMMLNSHPGTKYGIPFPVLSRASFGVHGAHVPSILRALVACGWFGIQTWIGGIAIYMCIQAFWPGIEWTDLPTGINSGQLLSFLAFWAINIFIIVKGIESIRWLEKWAAPVLILIGLVLFAWAVFYGGGISKVLDRSSEFTKPVITANYQDAQTIEINLNLLRDSEEKIKAGNVIVGTTNEVGDDGFLKGKRYPAASTIAITLDTAAEEGTKGTWFCQAVKDDKKSSIVSASAQYEKEGAPKSSEGKDFWTLFFPLLTAMVGFWATLSLNIPDFTRYAKSQKEQLSGQFLGLPLTMAFYSFIGLVATSAALLIFDDIFLVNDAPWDPVNLLGRASNTFVVLLSMFALAVATLSTNLAANVVAPANGFSNLMPKKISFKMGGIITGIVGILMMPWKLIASTQGYIFTWLIGYSALLGPIAGIVIADYYIVRRTRLSLPDLYKVEGKYHYKGGVNVIAIVAVILGVLPNLPGFLVTAGFMDGASVSMFLQNIYQYAWFVGFGISLVVYSIGMMLSSYPKD